MNDMMRPTLYEAWMDMKAVQRAASAGSCSTSSARSASRATGWRATAAWRCEQGDLLAMMSAGAYGMTMASNYTRAAAQRR